MVVRKRHLVRFSATVALFLAAPASAQLAGSIGVDSDYRLRGYSLTDDQPALTAQIAYDHPSGAYLNLTGLAGVGHYTRALGVIGDAGYAKRLNDRVTVDGGILRYQVGEAAPGKTPFRYTEVYAGAYVGRVSGRVYYSPDYRESGSSTLYAELEAGLEPATNWRVSGHVGLLNYLDSSYLHGRGSTDADWRVSVSRQFGKFEVHSALSTGYPRSYSGNRVDKSVAFTVGASLSF